MASRDAGVPAAVLTRIADGQQGIYTDGVLKGNLEVSRDLLAEIDRRVTADKSGMLDQELFLRVYSPPLRLIVVGAVHVAQALVPIARIAGFDPIIIDPRTAFATASRFPEVSISTDWPDVAVKALAPDYRTAVVTLTHDPKLDDPALQASLETDAFYIGSLGSRKTHSSRLERLRSHGWDEQQLARIHGPVGLNLGGRRPADIAVSIMAEIISVLNHRPE